MQAQPKFSVVIPAYNMAHFIGPCLRSVFAQTDEDFEVLVIDDGSKDDTARVVLGFDDPRLHLIRRTNGGLAQARNTGIKAARGELVAFLDADDCWLPTKLAAHRRALDQEDQAAVSYDWSCFINVQGERTGLTMAQTQRTLTHEALLLKNYLGNGSTAVVRRSVLAEVGGFDESLKRFVDHELWVRLAFRGERFCLVPQILTEYRVHPHSFTADTGRMLTGLEAFLDRISTYAPGSVKRLRPLARACTHRWMARAAFVAGNYPQARFHGRQALMHDFTVLWRDSRAAITLTAIGLQAITPPSVFDGLSRIGQRLVLRSLQSLLLLALIFSGQAALAQQPPAPALNFELAARKGDAYLLGAGDRVRVTIYGYEDLSGEQTVLGDGQIHLPLLGAFKVEGLTIEAATQELAERLTPYINRPQIGLSVLTPRPLRVGVLGQVNRPGPQVLSLTNTGNTLPTGNASALLTLSRALIIAGGITPAADLSQIELRRYRADGSLGVTRLNLWQNLLTQSEFVDPVLQDRDTIVVGTLPSGANQNPRLALGSSLAPERIAVAVGGEVRNPGAVSILANHTALDALIAAGGPIEGADLGNITLLRQQDGKLEARTLNLNAARQGDNAQNPILGPGDSLLVPRNGWVSFIDTSVGSILRPITNLAQLLFYITRL